MITEPGTERSEIQKCCRHSVHCACGKRNDLILWKKFKIPYIGVIISITVTLLQLLVEPPTSEKKIWNLSLDSER